MSDENGTAPEQDGTEQGGQDPTPTEPQQDDLADRLARLERENADLRKEAGKQRVNAKQQAAEEARQAVLQEFGKQLGFINDDEKPDPAKLTAAISEKDTRIGELEGSVRTLSVELAAYKSAGKHDADPAALLDSRSFLKSVEGLDPSADDFATQLEQAIKTAVENNPQLRAGRPPARGAAEFTGGPHPNSAADKAQPGLDRLRAAYAS